MTIENPLSLKLDEIIEITKYVPLFSSLSKAARQEVATCLSPISFEPEDPIVTQGEPGKEFYIIIEGKAGVVKNGKSVATLEPYDYFGEKSLLTEEPRNATVKAITKLYCLLMTPSSFKKIVHNPSMNLKFAKRGAIISPIGKDSTETVQGKVKDYTKDEQTVTFLLEKTPFCLFAAHLSDSQKKLIVDQMYSLTLPVGFEVIKEGNYGSEMFVIQNGEVVVTQHKKLASGTKKKGKETLNKKADIKKLAYLGNGDYFGELALLYKCARNASVTTTRPTQVWVLTNAVFRQVLTKHFEEDQVERVNFLKKVPLFSSLLGGEFNLLARSLDQLQFPEDGVVIKEDEEGESFFIVKSGSCDVTKDGVKIGTLKPGNFFGERALLTKEKRYATVTATEEVYVFMISKDVFNTLLGPLKYIIKEEADQREQKNKENLDSLKTKSPKDQKEVIKEDVIERKRKLNLSKGLKSFQIISVLGKGAFGTVKLAKHLETGVYVALKSLHIAQVQKTNTLSHLRNEKASLLLARECPYIVGMYDSFVDGVDIILVLEVEMGGELFTLLRKKGRFSESTSSFYVAQTLMAFEFLHEHNYVYRDLKPENIILSSAGYSKVIDLGFAKKLINNENTYTLCGTPDYLAPEVITGSGHCKSVDIWCMGIFIYELNAGYPPFRAPDEVSLFTEILHSNVEFPGFFSHDLKDLIGKLLKKKPSHRLGAGKEGIKAIFKHPWFKSLDIEAVQKHTIKPEFIPQVKNENDTSNFYADSDSEDDLDFESMSIKHLPAWVNEFK
eukprot:GAHX01000524.1.p1 GENE.GAHX01000524.1~~GAHX01000524.1.p1  ORF type:complete len:783 (-),score=182.54 GAHX01000524.1:750-3098(-)